MLCLYPVALDPIDCTTPDRAGIAGELFPPPRLVHRHGGKIRDLIFLDIQIRAAPVFDADVARHEG